MTYEDVPGYFDYADIYKDMAHEIQDGEHFVEVGCWLGRSSIYLASKLKELGKKNVTVWAVDDWQGDGMEAPGDVALLKVHLGNVFRMFVHNIKACGVADIITPVCQPSHRAVGYFEDRSLRAVFIDGLHTRAAVMCDALSWHPKVKPGGLLFGHDYNWASVRDGVDSVFPARSGGVQAKGSSWLRRV